MKKHGIYRRLEPKLRRKTIWITIILLASLNVCIARAHGHTIDNDVISDEQQSRL